MRFANPNWRRTPRSSPGPSATPQFRVPGSPVKPELNNLWSSKPIAAPPPPKQHKITSGGLFNFVLLITCLVVFNHFARPFERILTGLHLPAVICSVAILALIATGGLQHLKSPIGKVISLLSFWLIVVTPFSIWVTASATYTFYYLFFWVALLLLVAQAPRSAKDIVVISSTMVFSVVLYLIIGGKYDSNGRFQLDATFGNSDDVALLAGFAIPFVTLLALRFENPLMRYGMMASFNGFLLLKIGQTATRSAVFALLAMAGVYFLRSNAGQKVGLMFAGFVAVVGLVLVLPASTLSRFATIVDSFDSRAVAEQAGSDEAMASTADRKDLLYDAIRMAVTNPITGVGPDQYSSYRALNYTYASGAAKRYFPSHNTYAQIAAESGLPGLALYLLFLGTIFWGTRRIHKLAAATRHPDAKLLKQISICLEAALAYFVVCAVFMTCDRHPQQFLLAGMIIATERILNHWAAQHPVSPTLHEPVHFAQPVAAPAWAPARAGSIRQA